MSQPNEDKTKRTFGGLQAYTAKDDRKKIKFAPVPKGYRAPAKREMEVNYEDSKCLSNWMAHNQANCANCGYKVHDGKYTKNLRCDCSTCKESPLRNVSYGVVFCGADCLKGFPAKAKKNEIEQTPTKEAKIDDVKGNRIKLAPVPKGYIFTPKREDIEPTPTKDAKINEAEDKKDSEDVEVSNNQQEYDDDFKSKRPKTKDNSDVDAFRGVHEKTRRQLKGMKALTSVMARVKDSANMLLTFENADFQGAIIEKLEEILKLWDK